MERNEEELDDENIGQLKAVKYFDGCGQELTALGKRGVAPRCVS